MYVFSAIRTASYDQARKEIENQDEDDAGKFFIL
jgi:hypothetical protein